MITRRKFITLTSMATIGSLLYGANEPRNTTSFKRCIAKVTAGKNAATADEAKTLFGWKRFKVSKDAADCVLKFPDAAKITSGMKSPKVQLALANAKECWDNISIRAVLATSKKRIGIFDIKNSFTLQPLRIDIQPTLLPDIEREGISLEIVEFIPSKTHKDTRPEMFFYEEISESLDASALSPHLLAYEADYDAAKVFEQSYPTLSNLQPFGWMDGCQTEALFTMSQNGSKKADEVLEKHFAIYLSGGGANFENSVGAPTSAGKFESVEDFLPFAAIVKKHPTHKSIDDSVSWFKNHIAKKTKFLSTEGCYTLAYPMLEIAAARKDEKLATEAINQMLIRINYLVGKDGAIHQRGNIGQSPTYRNWSRGVAWYLLGLSYGLDAVKRGGFGKINGVRQMIAALQAGCAYAQKFGKDSLFCCFMDDPFSGYEASGSAGIAAAMAFGAKNKFIDARYADTAKKIMGRFLSQENITPDGLTKNVTQSNRLGETFQRSGYRVVMQLSGGLATLALENLKKS